MDPTAGRRAQLSNPVLECAQVRETDINRRCPSQWTLVVEKFVTVIGYQYRYYHTTLADLVFGHRLEHFSAQPPIVCRSFCRHPHDIVAIRKAVLA